MSMSMIVINAMETQRKVEEIRREEGDAAADKYACSARGASLGSLSGAAQGAILGSCLGPVGTVIGAFAGGMYGILEGVKDETPLDNVKTASGVLSIFKK